MHKYDGLVNGFAVYQRLFDLPSSILMPFTFTLGVQSSDKLNTPVRGISPQITGFVNNIVFLRIQGIGNKRLFCHFRVTVIPFRHERCFYENFTGLAYFTEFVSINDQQRGV